MGDVSAPFKASADASSKAFMTGGWANKLHALQSLVTPPPGDKESARLFGERVAKAATRWARGVQ